MKNLLYVSVSENNASVTGGSLGRENNFRALNKCDIKIFEYRIEMKKNFLIKILYSLLNFKLGLTNKHIKKILFIIKNNYIDLISVFINEYFSMKYSDRCVFLTERDYNNCKKRYKIECIPFFSPIALENQYSYKSDIIYNFPSKLLFVGSYFYPNIHGLAWFINSVLPYINYTLTIVGKGFERIDFLDKLNDKSKIIVKGFVKNLDHEYETNDIVVQPIFEGSGMKTKTAECFMYGKPLVSSSEGLVGYISNLENIFRCDTKESFIRILTNLQKKKLPSFCTKLHDYFEYNYSLESRSQNYRKLLEEMTNE